MQDIKFSPTWREIASGGVLEEVEELFNGIPSLFDDRHERAAFKVAAVVGESDPEPRLIRMFQVII